MTKIFELRYVLSIKEKAVSQINVQ
jgi:hypothetical protein